jgi:hypothetical protein
MAEMALQQAKWVADPEEYLGLALPVPVVKACLKVHGHAMWLSSACPPLSPAQGQRQMGKPA